jgi:hypothetical protein
VGFPGSVRHFTQATLAALRLEHDPWLMTDVLIFPKMSQTQVAIVVRHKIAPLPASILLALPPASGFLRITQDNEALSA